MARSGVQVDEVLAAPGLPEGEVHDRLLAAMAAGGDYQAVQVSPDRFHFARTFRPTWAIVTAWLTIWVVLIGIVFLFVKTTETCLAVIESDHRGVRVRLQGRISAAALGRLRAAMAGDAAFGAMGSVPQPAQMPGSPTAAAAPAQRAGAPVASTFPVVENQGRMPADPTAPTMQPAPMQSAVPSVSSGLPRPPSDPTTYDTPSAPVASTPPVVPPQATPATPAPRNDDVVIPPPPPETGREQAARAPVDDSQAAARNGAALPTPPEPPAVVPGAQTWVAPGETGVGSDLPPRVDEDDGDRTVVSGSGPLSEALASPPRPRAMIDDGSVIDLAALTLIGRDPAASEGEQALLVPIDDSTRSVSKTHLAIIFTEGSWSAVDRNSTNGVRIVGADDEPRPLTPGVPSPVTDGCVVRFGDRSLRLIEIDLRANGASASGGGT